jgi:hypothetical protein
MAKSAKLKMVIGLLATATSLTPALASAQNADDVIVMRRVLAPPKTSNAPEPTDPDVMGPVPGSNLSGYYWVISGWFSIDEDVCSSQAVQTRLRGCVRRGEAVDPSLCPDPAPINERIVEFYEGCKYNWVTSPSGNWLDSCSSDTKRPLSSVCVREDGVTVSDSFCSNLPREELETGKDFSGCTYEWNVGEFGPWEGVCNETTTRRRMVQCVRSDGENVPGTSCPQPAPASTEEGSNFTGCTYSWESGDWTPYDSACSVNATRTRTNTCIRSDEKLVDNSLCNPETEPETSESMEIVSGCGYEWVTGEYGEWSSTCSANSKRQRDVTCLRSDGVTVADGLCGGTGPEREETQEITTSCSYEWVVGPWTQSSTCSANAVKSRSVTCLRSDGRTVNDSFCSGPKAETQEIVSDFSNCQYSWEPNEWSSYDSTCSNNATRTRTASCFREDGQPADNEFCAGKTLPELSQQMPIYTGCERFWTTGTWSNYNSTCSATATRGRTVGCTEIRPNGNISVELGLCDQSTRPVNQETAAIYTSCSKTWVTGTDWGWNGTVGAFSSTCNTQAQQTRTMVCQATLTNGVRVIVPDAECTTARPVETRTVSNVSTCTYSYLVGQWTAFDSTCSANSTRTRTVECKQSDPLNLTVADSNCVNRGAGPVPARTQTVSNVTDCTGLLVNSGFEDGLTGWTNSTTRPVVLNETANRVRTGIRSARLTGSGSFLSQTVNTVPGQYYAISLWHFAANSADTVNIVVNGVVIAQPQPFSSFISDASAWRELKASFVATGETTTITLPSRSTGVANAWIDQVVFSAVPGPG